MGFGKDLEAGNKEEKTRLDEDDILRNIVYEMRENNNEIYSPTKLAHETRRGHHSIFGGLSGYDGKSRIDFLIEKGYVRKVEEDQLPHPNAEDGYIWDRD